MHSVSRTASSRLPLPRFKFKRIARDASVPAPGATAAEFTRPRACASRVSLRSVASEYGTSPRNALCRVFRTLKRAAAAKKRRRIAERLARVAEQLARMRVSQDGLGKVLPEESKVPRVSSSRRLQ